MEWRPPALCVLVLAFSWGLQVNAIRVRRSNHVDNVCSMWGNFHFKTFDGDIYQFQGICEYNLVSHCHGPVKDFSVHVKRAEFPGDSKITRVLVTIGDMAIELTKNLVMVNSDIVKLPHYVAGVLLEQYATYIKLYAKLGLSVMWNRDDAVMVELDSKYTNHTCGLCGDFNGMLILNEFISEAREIDPVEFGNKQRVHNPNSLCEDLHEEDEPITMGKCQAFRPGCSELLEDKAWSSCTNIVSPEPYIQACVMDRCWSLPGDIEDSQSMCSTLSEYSRQCSHAGGMPPNWRKPDFCAVKCPYNMEYSESGSPCVDTCSHRDTSLLCEEHKMDGCFCPPGTVFDDISDRGCIPQEQCQCKHNKVYNSGDVLQMEGKECVCHHGSWTCESLPTPGLCAVEEGSHFMTFDGKEFTFHGDCYYVLSQDCMESAFTVLGQLIPCVDQETDTCLKSVVLLPNNDKNNALIIKDDGTVRQNGDLTLPYASANLMVFRPSSFHIIVHTSFGLQMQVQLVPIMQLYITLDKSYQTKTCGLCGNFNMVLSDELKTPQGLVEGTAASFANSWKAQATCPDRSERLDDPCSYNIDSESYAEHWCSKVKEKEGQFAKCHSSVNPESYYKRCKYSTCTCEKTENCLCAVFSSYVRACTAKGIFLQDWRDTVCEKYTGHCPATQTFSYLLQGCQRTCDSLSSERQACINDYVPVDGCACPHGLYENENGVCVALDKCSCYHNGEHIKPGKSITIKNEHCVCTNGNLHCHSWKPLVTECQAPKVFFNCSESGPDEHGLECAQTCTQRNVDCYLAGCTSGCQCPSGLLDDGRGHCVPQHNCPCKHNDHYYLSGSKITVQCNTCTCKQGTWKCTDKKCPGTCTIYGSGHYNTFDDQRFGFSGDCGYIAVQNKCGNKTGTFHVITENVPCGTTGTTCSKSVRIVLGKTQLDLIDGKVTNTDLDTGTLIKHRVRNVGLYLAIEADIGLTVLWDRKTTVRIILQPQHMGEVCGLCGNYNENGKDDFTTQGQLQVSDVLEFANSWKVNSHCPDADPDFDPCSKAQNRHTWAKMQCSIITGETFKDCHRMVDPAPYFDNCVRDSCACDTGGDCECFCTAVGAYAQACNEAGVCVAWRTPEICPVFCEYYNDPLECLWHYSPCHTPCYKTCLNPDGICRSPLPNLEGCYPKCPEDKPIFDEEKQICVEKCEGCFINGTEYETGEEIPSDKPCTLCLCDESGWETCSPREGCCFYNETEYGDYDVIYNVTDNMGMCYYAICINSTVIETSKPCPTPTPPTSEPTTTFTTSTTGESTTQFIVTTTTAIPTSTSQSQPTPTVSQETTECIICDWTEWFNVYNPSTGNGNDLELYKNIHDAGKTICETPEDIECRAISNPDISFDEFVQQTGQIVQCNVSIGLVCEKDHQNVRPFKCINYEIRVLCCGPCESTPSPTTIMTTPKETTTSETTPHPGSEGTSSTSTPTTTPETEQTTTSLTTTKATTTEVIVEQTTLPPETTPSSKPITTTTTAEVTHVSTTTPETEQTPSPTTSTTTATIPTETTTSTITTEPTTHEPTVVTAEIITKSPQTEPQIEITTEQTSTTVRTTKATTTSEVTVEPTTPYPETEETTPTSTPTTTTTTTEVPHVSTTTPETEQPITTETTTKASTITSEVTVEPTTPYPETEETTPTSKPTTTTTTTEVPHVSTTTPESEQTTTTGTTTKEPITSEVIVEPTTPYPETEETTPTSKPTTTTTTTEVPHVSTTTPETEQPITTETTTKASTITSEVTVEPTTPYPGTEGTTPTSTPTTTTTTTEVPHVSTTTPETEQPITTETTTKASTITSEVTVEPTTPYPETEETTPTSKPTTTTTTTEVPHVSTTTPETEQPITTETTTKASTITSEVTVEPTTPYPGTEETTPTSTPTTTTTTTEVPHVSTTTPETEQTTTTGTTTKEPITSEVIVEPTTPYPGTEGTTPTSTPTTTTTTTEGPHVSTTTPETEQTSTTVTTTKETSTTEVIGTQTTPPLKTTPLSTPTTTTTTTTGTSTSTRIPSTTVCVCVINGKHYEPGETIFDMIHIGSGICLTMICSNICEIKNKTQPCPTTTSPPLTTPKFDCPEWDVNQNETFEICNCTMARCIEDNIIEIIPYECPPIENITCSNGKKPVLVPDENYCCEEYACDCFCEGWGDPHYITFDGLFYSHQGNCTYVLMEEISPKHNLKIYIDNVNCDPREFVSCPRALIVSYNNVVITLRNNNLIGAAKLEALLGHTTMKLPFTKNGVQVLGSGVNMILEIPQLGVVLTFGVTGFSVNLPFRHFGENTQGHCGTCNNNKKDDCMLPGGKLIDDCAVMADYWPAKDLYNPDCPQPPTVPPTSAPTKKPCPTNPVCELLKTDLFKECHPFISPDNYFTGCQFDSCHVTNPAVVCTSLQTYASACSQFGVCLHWRNHTNICTVTCEGDKVYKPCGPAEPPTCHDRPNGMSMNVTTEGCFCPDGTMLFNKDSGVCVDKCGCLDPSGQARELGEKFQHNCQDCLCEATTASVTCQPKQCSNDNPVICSEPGFIVVNETDPTDECCTIFTCRCDSTFCPNIDGKCEIGYGPVLTVPEGKCCPELICEPKKVCVHKNIEYEPGTTTPVVDCQECHCTSEVDPKSQLYKVRCGMVACNEDCEPGYKYMEPLGEECCGKCVQTKCVISHNGTRHVLQDGEEWVPKKPGCDKFICVNVAGEYITTNYKIQCPPFNIDDCQPGTMQLSADGCCQVCVEKEQGCKVETTFDYITDNDCWSEKRVEQTFCEGNCNSYSKYSELGSSSCGCCQASRTSNRTVTLNCANGNSVQHTYIQVEECSCNQTECHATLSAETKN